MRSCLHRNIVPSIPWIAHIDAALFTTPRLHMGDQQITFAVGRIHVYGITRSGPAGAVCIRNKL